MINILLVDDEYLIRAKINKYLKDSIFKFDNIYEASNGLDALEIIKSNNVDIAIVDIQMPLINGIEFVKILREEYYETKIIFLTGFEKFEYARQAIQYNIIEYLLKPIKKDELYNSIEKCFSIIYSEQKNLIALNEINEKKKYQFIIDSLCEDLNLNYSPLTIKDNLNVVVSVELSKTSYIIDLYKFLDNNFKSYDVIYCLSKYNKILILDCTYSENIKNLFLSLINTKLVDYCYFSISTNKIKDKVFECLTVFPSKIFFNKNCIFLFEEIKYKSLSLPNNLKLDFELLARTNSKDKLISKLIYYMYEIEKFKDINALKTLVSYFLTALDIVILKDESSLSLIDMDYIINNLLYSSKSLEDIKVYCISYYNKIISINKPTKLNDSTKIITKVKNYIDKNYTSENLNLEYLSNKFFINSSHLSSTFKKITGESLIEYITKRRIDKAKSLIKNNEIKISEIAEKVGYKDYYYFSKIFKKHVGIPPLKYKQLSYDTIKNQ